LVRAETDLEIALARVKQAEEETELYGLECQRIQAQIDRRHIRSPINGVIAEGYKEVGEAVLASDPRLLTLVQLDQLRIRFSAVPDQTARIRPGQSAEMCLAENSQPIHGTVDRIDAVMDAKSGTLDIHVVIDNTHGQLRSGMRCLLSISNTTSHLQRSPTTAHNPTRRVGLPP
jgi:multidrug efflux pump subunit AcrA (membrane-fusion protein)